MTGTIPEKDTPSRAKRKFPFVIGAKVGPASTTKNSKSIIVWFGMEKLFDWGHKIEDFSGKKVYEKGGSEEGFIPEFKRHGGIGKQGKTNFNNVTVFAFSRPVLLMSMWA